MKKSRKTFIGVIFLTIVLVLSACSQSSSNSEEEGKDVSEIKIGSVHPLSGASAIDGQQMQNAINMAIEEINESGGIKSLDGAKIKLLEGDSESKPEKGVSETQRLARDGAVAILGPYNSPVALAATQEAEKLKIPFVVTIASTKEVTERGFKYTFRLQPDSILMADNFLTHFKEFNEKSGANLKTAVITHEDSSYGSTIADHVEKNAEKAGLEILARLHHPLQALDLTSEINRIKSLNPDVIIAANLLPDGTLFNETLAESGYKPKAIIGIANGAYSNADFVETKRDINQYLLDANYAYNAKSELAQKVAEKYQEKFGQALGPNAAYAYTATYVLIDAIERAGSTDKDKIREALTKTNFEDHILPQGPITFDEKGQNEGAQAVMNQIIDGKYLTVFPEEYKVEDLIFPNGQK